MNSFNNKDSLISPDTVSGLPTNNEREKTVIIVQKIIVDSKEFRDRSEVMDLLSVDTLIKAHKTDKVENLESLRRKQIRINFLVKVRGKVLRFDLQDLLEFNLISDFYRFKVEGSSSYFKLLRSEYIYYGSKKYFIYISEKHFPENIPVTFL